MRPSLPGLAVILLTLLPAEPRAHPLDEVLQGAYLTLAPGEVRLELDLTPGTNIADALLQALDANADRIISDAEAQRYARRVLAQSSLTLDDVAVSWALGGVNVPPYGALEAGVATIAIRAVAARPDSAGTHVLDYRNDHQPAPSLRTANVFLEPGEGWQYRVVTQQRSDEGARLTVTYTIARQ
jgi:hypothetical protein